MEPTTSNQIVRSVWMVLRLTFGLVPIVAGADKFTDLLVNWDTYLNPDIASMLPFSAHVFMQIVGGIEIIAGLIVLAKPSVGGWIVMAWLICISLQLLAMAIYFDVAVRDLLMASGDNVEKAATRVEQELGAIDIWINNAMVSVFSPVKEMKAEEYKRVTEVTYLGVVYGTLAALKKMLPRNSGTIVQVGSALAYRSIPLQSAYCAAKHAVAGFIDSLRCELVQQKSKVHVTMLQMPALN